MDTARLVIAVDSSGAAKATRNLDNLDRAAGKSERAAHKLGKAWGTAIGLLSSAVIIGATRSFLRQADAMANLNARLGLVTDSAQGLAKAQQDVFDIAQRTATDLEATGDLYVKLAQSSDDLRRNQERLGGIVETVSKSLVVSGADASSTAAVIRQFSQALASGALRGDEFISVMEGAPRLARAIADGLGVPIGQLRALAAQGELTADKIITALEAQSAAVDREFGKMPLTVGRAVEKVENALQRMVSKTDDATGASGDLAVKIDELATLLQSEGVQQGFNAIVGGLADVASFAVKATTNMANFTRQVAESLAASVNGVSRDDLVRQAGEIKAMQELIDARKKAGWKRDTPMFGWGDLQDELDQMKAEYANNLKLFAPRPMIITGDSGQIPDSAFRPKVATGGGITSGGTSGATGKLKEQAAAVEKVMTLEEEWALLESEVYTPAMIEAHNQRATAWANEAQEVEKATDKMSVFAEEAARNIHGALADGLLAVTKGKFDEIGDNFADMLERMMADLAASKLLEAFGGWASGYTGAGSGWINAIGAALGGGRAGEGPVMAGQTYRVGENGSELFTPATNGTISKGGNVTVKQGNINLEVINNGQPAQATVSHQTGPNGEQLIRLILNVVGDSIASGRGAPYKAAKMRFGLRDAMFSAG